MPMQATDVEALCRRYQAGAEVTRALTTLARQSKAEVATNLTATTFPRLDQAVALIGARR